MQDVLAQAVAEMRALGLWCLIHGPEAWLALVAVCIFAAGFVDAVIIGVAQQNFIGSIQQSGG